VLAFQGESDEFGTIEQLNVLKKEILTDVTIVEIRNAAHTPRKEAETETMALLTNWLKTIPWLK
jgi:predicted alpha/beta-hydrolase family hydrolase